MMRKTMGFILLLVLTLMACTGHRYPTKLVVADSLCAANPDSALRLLTQYKDSIKSASKADRMFYELLLADAMNKAYVDMTTDSILKEVTDYYDRHGSANEQMRAHYLLGCAYRDMGEAPMALQCYQDAVDKADTLSHDCNYALLSCIFSQISTLYHSQLLLSNEIEAQKKASFYAFRANKIQWGIYNQVMSAGAYILMNKKDSAEIILKSAIEQYRINGYSQEALRFSRSLIHLYLENPQRLTEAKALMDRFEAESDLFDEHHELPSSQRQFYDYKGKYYEAIHQFDSAEYYYRKIYRPDMSYASQNPMYKGLLSVFSKRHLADSVAKYAYLYGMANDSSIALKDQNIMAQMTATFNYNRLQREANENEVRAYRTTIELFCLIILMIVVLASSFLILKLKQKRYNQKISQLMQTLADASSEYAENLRELQMLETTHQKVISVISRELEEAQSENISYREKFSMSQHTIFQINQEYEREKTRLLEENKELQKRIDELQRDKLVSKHLSISVDFTDKEIVKRIYNASNNPFISISEKDWNDLLKEFGNSYPLLLQDLYNKCNNTQIIRVCILTSLGIGGSEQANMLGITKQRISNLKASLNKILFNETSSRTLNRNLLIHYNVYCLNRDAVPK